MLTIATLLSGGEGVGVGARAAGLRHLWGIEIKDAIAQVARDNGFNVKTGDLHQVSPWDLEAPDILHASPECINASQANAAAGETVADIDMAHCIMSYVRVLSPRIFTLENVVPYRNFVAFRRILEDLAELGYFTAFSNENSADYGVPQTRRRLILRAVRGGLVPTLPPPVPWGGWYEAIEDLIPGLPDSQFAPWQIKRWRGPMDKSVLLSQGISRDHKGGEYPLPTRAINEPAYTVTANSNQNAIRAFLIGGQCGQPAGTEDRVVQERDGDEPAFTVTAGNKGDWRAVLVDGSNMNSGPTVRVKDDPAFTVTSNVHKIAVRAFASGRVVKLTPRCLARFQSFSDSYILPSNNGLASQVIGNAVPPLMYQKIIEAMIR